MARFHAYLNKIFLPSYNYRKPKQRGDGEVQKHGGDNNDHGDDGEVNNDDCDEGQHQEGMGDDGEENQEQQQGDGKAGEGKLDVVDRQPHGDENDDDDVVLSLTDVRYVSLKTALVWAKKLGMTYMARKNSYYCDGHDRADVLRMRNNDYLPREHELELRQFLWVRLTADQMEQLNIEGVQFLEEKGMIVPLDEMGMCEVHVDLLPVSWREREEFTDVANGIPLGGKRSCFAPPGERPVIKVGYESQSVGTGWQDSNCEED
jgi:hypothetical protein